MLLLSTVHVIALQGYLLLIGQLIPHAGQESSELAVRKVGTLLLQFGTLLLGEDEHG